MEARDTLNDVLKQLRAEIKRQSKPENMMNYQRWFKEKLKNPVGLKGPVHKKISNQFFKLIKDESKKQILDYCEELLASEQSAERGIAFMWASNISGRLTKADFPRLERWLKKYVCHWGACDSLCCGALGALIHQYPELIPRAKKWTSSNNRWMRRGAAVCMIPSLGKGTGLKEAFSIADLLLTDNDDMVQKGYGWMLKVAADSYQKKIFDYVMKNKREMPRTALRYAIEKMPQNLKKEAMKKDR